MAEEKFHPPIKLLMQSVMPDGTRWPLLKRGKKVWTAPSRIKGEWEQHAIYGPVRKQKMWQRDVTPPKRLDFSGEGNLQVEEYRFWQGGELAVSQWARCRACRWVVCESLRAVRMKVHMDRYKCSVHLTAAYGYLLAQKKCVVCEKKCTGGKWGVPLCSTECQHRWMFDDPTYPLLFEAMAKTNTPEMQGRLRSAKETWERMNNNATT